MSSNIEMIAKWHAEKPEFTKHFTARDWDTAELVAEQLDAAAASENVDCDLAPEGMYCVLEKGHSGPCKCFVKDF
jgi:hypothetical protein